MEVRYRPFLKTDCDEVINLWSKTEGIYLHSNGEDSIDGIKDYLDRNSGFSFVAEHEGHIVGAVLCGHDGRRGFLSAFELARRRYRNGLFQTSLNSLNSDTNFGYIWTMCC